MHMPRVTRSHAVADRPLARRIGGVIRAERLRAHLTQSQLAEGRYTKAYISALENGLAKPSLAALNFLADRLQVPVTKLMAAGEPAWTRLEADLHLAAGDWQQAVDAFHGLLDAGAPDRVRPELLFAPSPRATSVSSRGPKWSGPPPKRPNCSDGRAATPMPRGRPTGRRAGCMSSNRAMVPASCSSGCSTRSPRD